jgi:PAS domain S-box-containing protein
MLKNQVSFRFTAAQDVAAHTNAMLAYWDKDLVCRYANDAYLEWFGYTPQEMIGKMTLPQLLGDTLYQKNRPYIEAALAGKVQVFEREISTPVGESRQSLATYNPDIIDGEVVGFFVHVADITQLKSQSPVDEDAYSKAAVFTSHSPDETLNDVEKTLRSHLFLPFPGISFLAKKHLVSSSKLKRDFKKRYGKTIFAYFRYLQMEVAEIYIKDKKHSKKQVAELLKFANPSNFLNAYKKYLQEKSTRQVIADLEKATDDRYKIFISQSPVAIAMFDKKLNLMAASHKWVMDYGLQDRELNGINFYEFFPGVRERWEIVNKKCMEGEINQGEELFTRPDGSNLWLRWDIRCWLNSKNEPGGIIVFSEDITLATQKEADNKRLLEILLKTSEVTRIGVWERNFSTERVFWNKVTYEILDMPEDKLPPKELALDLYSDPSEREMIRNHINMAKQHGQSFDFIATIDTVAGNKKKLRVVGFSEMREGVCERLYGIIKEISTG